jgi:hypothetical protein
MRVMGLALCGPLLFGIGCITKDSGADFGGGGIAVDDTGGVSGGNDTGGVSSEYQRVFDEVISPKCRACHSGDRSAGGLRLESQDESYSVLLSGYVVPGEPDSSLLVERITLDIDDDSLMPPNAQLNDDKVSIVVDWVLAGALE